MLWLRDSLGKKSIRRESEKKSPVKTLQWRLSSKESLASNGTGSDLARPCIGTVRMVLRISASSSLLYHPADFGHQTTQRRFSVAGSELDSESDSALVSTSVSVVGSAAIWELLPELLPELHPTALEHLEPLFRPAERPNFGTQRICYEWCWLVLIFSLAFDTSARFVYWHFPNFASSRLFSWIEFLHIFAIFVCREANLQSGELSLSHQPLPNLLCPLLTLIFSLICSPLARKGQSCWFYSAYRHLFRPIYRYSFLCNRRSACWSDGIARRCLVNHKW